MGENMKPTNTENATALAARKQLTLKEQMLILNHRAKEWNRPVSLWTKVMLGKK